MPFLFIIMLLNLKDEELGEFEFKLHHLLSLASVLGLFFFIYSAIAPLVDEDVVSKQRAVAAQKVGVQRVGRCPEGDARTSRAMRSSKQVAWLR